jgi:hypothetical protein
MALRGRYRATDADRLRRATMHELRGIVGSSDDEGLSVPHTDTDSDEKHMVDQVRGMMRAKQQTNNKLPTKKLFSVKIPQIFI